MVELIDIRKRRLSIAIAVILILAAIAGIFYAHFKYTEAVVTDLGNPYFNYYGEGKSDSRAAWDMVYFDGKVYVGGGDFDKNTGPVPVYSYDTVSGRWSASDELLPDEQIKRFRVIDGDLYIPGTDPRGNWNSGNFYRLENGKFVTHSELMGGVHNFDVVKFDGKLFFGLGVTSGNSPVVMYDGEEYFPVPFMKSGSPLNTYDVSIIRVYNFVVHNDTLYAFLSLDGETTTMMDLYKYEDGAFVFCFGSMPSFDMPECTSLFGKVFLHMDYNIMTTTDFTQFFPVSLSAATMDTVCTDDAIYAITTREYAEKHGYVDYEEENRPPTSYLNTIYRSLDGTKFEPVISFESELPVSCFTVNPDGNTFYVSTGIYGDADNNNTGKVLSVRKYSVGKFSAFIDSILEKLNMGDLL